jgi:hypothetical protein
MLQPKALQKLSQEKNTYCQTTVIEAPCSHNNQAWYYKFLLPFVASQASKHLQSEVMEDRLGNP